MSSEQRDIMLSVRALSKAYTITSKISDRPTTLAEATVRRFLAPLRREERETFWALKDVSFDVRRGDVVGVIGRNGAGKSTLFKILSRITEITTGEVDLYGRVGSLLEVGTGFSGELTGRENIYLNGTILGMRRVEISKRFDEIVDFAGVEKFLDTPVKRYSSGMYVRLAFAVAAHLDSEILIVDEVLAVGDAEFQRKCLGKLHLAASSGRSVLFVSHDIRSLRELCSSSILLAEGKIVATGTVDDVAAVYNVSKRSCQSREFNDGLLRRVSVDSSGDKIIISAAFDTGSSTFPIPCLGILLCDAARIPILSTNPRQSGIFKLENPIARGTVQATLDSPRLRNGEYSLDFWFGDGVRDVVEVRDCLQFTVNSEDQFAFSGNMSGSVLPRVKWTFESDSTDSMTWSR